MCGFKTEVKHYKELVKGQFYKRIITVYVFGPGGVKHWALPGAEAEDINIHLEALISLGLAAASLVVDHGEQNPQVQKSDDHEAHQNCDKETALRRYLVIRFT